MAKINTITIDTYQRGDSAVLPWSLQYVDENGETKPKNLTGYIAALTISPTIYTKSADDVTPDEDERSAAIGYNDTPCVVTVDCDDREQMHGLKAEDGKILFDLHKQMMWLDPGVYFIDIVLENKETKRTRTYAIGKIEIQGHPTNRLTTDEVDSYSDIESEGDL